MKRTTFLFALLALLALCSIEVPAQSRKPSVDTLKRKMSSVQSKKRSLEREIRATRREAGAVMTDIRKVDGELSTLEDSLESTGARLTAGMSERERIQEELKVATAALYQKEQAMKARLRRIYMDRTDSPWMALLTSKSLGDLAQRQTLLSKVAERDRALFDELKELRSQVQSRKKRQDALVNEIAGLKERQEDQQDSLEDRREAKKGYLAELKSRQADLRRQYDQLDAESDRLAEQIRAYQRKVSGTRAAVSPFRGTFSWPVHGRVSSGFGYRNHPILKERRLHAGIDIAAKTGTTITAAAPGVVIFSGYRNGYGNTVVIDHGGDLSTLYGHCSRLYVSAGQKVDRGTRIAAVGSTGLATGPHLHFEVRVNGRPVDPRSRL